MGDPPKTGGATCFDVSIDILSYPILYPCISDSLSIYILLFYSFISLLPWWQTPLPFRTSTLHDRGRHSNSGVPTDKALHHAGAAIFMRSTSGSGTLAGPRLALEGFLSQKRKGTADSDSPGLNHPGALGRQRFIPSIYHCWANMLFEWWWDVPRLDSDLYMQVLRRGCSFIFACTVIQQSNKEIVNAKHILVYTRYMP